MLFVPALVMFECRGTEIICALSKSNLQGLRGETGYFILGSVMFLRQSIEGAEILGVSCRNLICVIAPRVMVIHEYPGNQLHISNYSRDNVIEYSCALTVVPWRQSTELVQFSRNSPAISPTKQHLVEHSHISVCFFLGCRKTETVKGSRFASDGHSRGTFGTVLQSPMSGDYVDDHDRYYQKSFVAFQYSLARMNQQEGLSFMDILRYLRTFRQGIGLWTLASYMCCETIR